MVAAEQLLPVRKLVNSAMIRQLAESSNKFRSPIQRPTLKKR